MNVFVTGATGALGSATVPLLLAAGHHVRGVARDEAKAEQLRHAGADAAIVDLFDPEAILNATAGCDAIAHLATNVPPVERAVRRRAWSTHDRLRSEATRYLLAAAAAHSIDTFVKESIVYVYPDRGDQWIDETVPPDATLQRLEATLDGERQVGAFSDAGGRGVVLRFGLFYGSSSRTVDEALRMARLRGSLLAGSSGAYESSIHTDDAAGAVVAAVDAPAGIYNIVDDEPVTRREYLDAFSRAFALPHLHSTPGWLLRTVGGSSARVLLASQRVANGRFRATTGWAPRYPSVREGWAAVAEARGVTAATR
jgi:nucleoside-diphosphate-sugar epimerase